LQGFRSWLPVLDEGRAVSRFEWCDRAERGESICTYCGISPIPHGGAREMRTCMERWARENPQEALRLRKEAEAAVDALSDRILGGLDGIERAFGEGAT
jgi:hypothetical protein